jgi:hypothetical protein
MPRNWSLHFAIIMVGLATGLAACMTDRDVSDEDLVDKVQALADDPTLEQGTEALQQPGDTSKDGLTISKEQDEALLAPCGESLRPCNINQICVDYRHCTSGSDSLRVRAIIHLGPDGPCTTVGPGQTKLIWIYGGISFFDRIDRC